MTQEIKKEREDKRKNFQQKRTHDLAARCIPVSLERNDKNAICCCSMKNAGRSESSTSRGRNTAKDNAKQLRQ